MWAYVCARAQLCISFIRLLVIATEKKSNIFAIVKGTLHSGFFYTSLSLLRSEYLPVSYFFYWNCPPSPHPLWCNSVWIFMYEVWICEQWTLTINERIQIASILNIFLLCLYQFMQLFFYFISNRWHHFLCSLNRVRVFALVDPVHIHFFIQMSCTFGVSSVTCVCVPCNPDRNAQKLRNSLEFTGVFK